MQDSPTFLLTVWLAFFGAAIGSFLNVVVYRLPLGKSLVSPPSHCPKCSHRIRWFDNVPVFGWLMLGGKCRDCKEPISVRYPLVEIFCGAVFGIIGFLTLEQGGDVNVLNLLCLSGIQSVLVVSLLTIGLIQFDGQPIPWSLWIPNVVLASFALSLALEVSPVPEAYRLTGGNPSLWLMLVFPLCLLVHTIFFSRFFDGIVFAVICVSFGWFTVPVVAITSAILVGGRWILGQPLRCPYLVLAFVTFVVVVGSLSR